MQVRPALAQVERRPLEVRTPGSRWPVVRRMVVVRHDRLGDVVVTLPAVNALRRAYPGARLALMVRPNLAPLARMVDGVDEVLDAAGGGARVRRQLLEFEADLVVCISRTGSMAWSAALAGVRHRVGPGYRWYSALFERRVNERRRAGLRHEVEYALSFAHRAGAPTVPPRFHLRVPKDVRRAATDWLGARGMERGFVALHPGSGGSCPAWPVESYLRLAALVAAERRPVLISIGPADTAVARALESAPAEVRSLPRFSGGLQELIVLCRRAGVFVSNSTGPLHLAAASGTPALGFYPPWPTCGVERWGPYSEKGWALVAACAEAEGWSRRERRRHAGALMQGIPPELAAKCVLDLLDGRTPRIP